MYVACFFIYSGFTYGVVAFEYTAYPFSWFNMEIFYFSSWDCCDIECMSLFGTLCNWVFLFCCYLIRIFGFSGRLCCEFPFPVWNFYLFLFKSSVILFFSVPLTNHCTIFCPFYIFRKKLGFSISLFQMQKLPWFCYF